MPAVDRVESRFLGLPGELRNRIYGLAVEACIAHACGNQDYHEPGLLQTCRSLRAESRNILADAIKLEVACSKLKIERHSSSMREIMIAPISRANQVQKRTAYRLRRDREKEHYLLLQKMLIETTVRCIHTINKSIQRASSGEEAA